MSKLKYFRIKQKRYFYVIFYRNILNTLIFSGICNLIFLGVATYLFLNRGEHTFFATSGYTNPEQLTPVDGPNYADHALLVDDIPIDDGPDTTLIR